MCDCYEAKCKVCGISGLPVHLGDYETNRDEIEVYCKGHIPPTNCRIFVTKSQSGRYPKKFKMGIRALTENAKKNKEINHPNLNSDFVVVDV